MHDHGRARFFTEYQPLDQDAVSDALLSHRRAVREEQEYERNEPRMFFEGFAGRYRSKETPHSDDGQTIVDMIRASDGVWEAS